ncbi:hypothetical protein QQF73_11435 [Marinobacter sp. M216]|uniref:DUF1761 domain-containing protein n=1 Tax=Marinobacter albus TaxID=3030833 RepID=A0ABT7HD02_9GAMM|nr:MULTISPECIES: hypothetical protein [unclassified Marinobacter]MBW7469498.1 hypothetical protein [Marinobacter sp. F4218]MDK9558233.1 hypothetical protein [Marinobacter sp. M216]
MLETVLVLNVIWFAMAFNVFSIRNKIFAKVLVPREHRQTPVFDVLAESGRFLGGFNFAFALLNILLLINLDVFPSDAQRSILLWVIAVAHGSQFVFNVPVAIQNRRGEGVWQVKGLMLFIFVTDFIMMVLNLAMAVSYIY